MMKKIVIMVFSVVSLYVFADNSNPTYRNRPAIGSKPASNQLFGDQPLTGEKDEKYNKPKAKGEFIPNRPAIGSKPASNQLFGNQPLTGKKGQVYNKNMKNTDEANKPSIGSKPASNQLFGNQPLTNKDEQMD